MCLPLSFSYPWQNHFVQSGWYFIDGPHPSSLSKTIVYVHSPFPMKDTFFPWNYKENFAEGRGFIYVFINKFYFLSLLVFFLQSKEKSRHRINNWHVLDRISHRTFARVDPDCKCLRALIFWSTLTKGNLDFLI